MSQTPRHINTSRSLNRPDPAAAAPRHAASSTDAKQSAGGAHNEPPRRPAQGAGQKPPRRRKKKKKKPLWLPFAVVMAIIAVISGVVVYGVSLVNKVEDSIRPDDSTPTIEEEVKTAEEYKGDVVNILVCGIDYEEGRNYSNDPTSNDGMTDMILYVQFDIKNGIDGLQSNRGVANFLSQGMLQTGTVGMFNAGGASIGAQQGFARSSFANRMF